jgi:hypothetical protein
MISLHGAPRGCVPCNVQLVSLPEYLSEGCLCEAVRCILCLLMWTSISGFGADDLHLTVKV